MTADETSPIAFRVTDAQRRYLEAAAEREQLDAREHVSTAKVSLAAFLLDAALERAQGRLGQSLAEFGAKKTGGRR